MTINKKVMMPKLYDETYYDEVQKKNIPIKVLYYDYYIFYESYKFSSYNSF